jgi:hypothetical protein
MPKPQILPSRQWSYALQTEFARWLSSMSNGITSTQCWDIYNHIWDLVGRRLRVAGCGLRVVAKMLKSGNKGLRAGDCGLLTKPYPCH